MIYLKFQWFFLCQRIYLKYSLIANEEFTSFPWMFFVHNVCIALSWECKHNNKRHPCPLGWMIWKNGVN